MRLHPEEGIVILKVQEDILAAIHPHTEEDPTQVLQDPIQVIQDLVTLDQK